MASTRVEEIVAALRRRVTSALHLRRLQPGDRLPSVRDVADEFGVHQRDALAAYRALEADGLVELRARSGVYVRQARPAGTMLPKLTERLVDFLVDALGMDIPAPDVPEHVRRCLETVHLRAVCIECNLDQIDSLCTQLHRDYGLTSEGAELDAIDTDVTRSVLRRADLLVTTSFHVDAVRRVAERLGKPWIAVSLRTDLVAEMTRALAAGPVYIVGTDPRFAEKAREMFAGSPGGANVRPLIVGRDDVSQIPPDAALHVMSRAREQLRDDPFLARVPPPERTLSLDSARALLRFVVEANVAAMAGMSAR